MGSQYDVMASSLLELLGANVMLRRFDTSVERDGPAGGAELADAIFVYLPVAGGFTLLSEEQGEFVLAEGVLDWCRGRSRRRIVIASALTRQLMRRLEELDVTDILFLDAGVSVAEAANDLMRDIAQPDERPIRRLQPWNCRVRISVLCSGQYVQWRMSGSVVDYQQTPGYFVDVATREAMCAFWNSICRTPVGLSAGG